MYNFAKLFPLSQQWTLLCIALIFTVNDEQKFASTANKTQQQHSHVTVSQTKPSPDKVSPVS